MFRLSGVRTTLTAPMVAVEGSPNDLIRKVFGTATEVQLTSPHVKKKCKVGAAICGISPHVLLSGKEPPYFVVWQGAPMFCYLAREGEWTRQPPQVVDHVVRFGVGKKDCSTKRKIILWRVISPQRTTPVVGGVVG